MTETQTRLATTLAQRWRIDPLRLRRFLPRGIFIAGGGIRPEYLPAIYRALSQQLGLPPAEVRTGLKTAGGLPSVIQTAEVHNRDYVTFCGLELVSQTREELEGKLKDTPANREAYFLAGKSVLKQIGFAESAIYLYDKTGERIVPLQDAPPPFPALASFAATRQTVEVTATNDLLIKVRTKDETYVLAANRGAEVPGGKETLTQAGQALHEVLEEKLGHLIEVQILEARIARLQVLRDLGPALDQQIAQARRSRTRANLIENIVGILPLILPRLRSATISLWNEGEQRLQVVAHLGIDLKNLDQGALSLAQHILLEKKKSCVSAARLNRRDHTTPLPRSGDFAIVPFYADNRPLGVITISIEAGRYLEEDQVQALEYLAHTLKGKTSINRVIKELERASQHDGLTSLYNHLTGLSSLEDTFLQAGRDGQPLACLMLDIDHFKQVNDTYGHKAGDLVLQQISSIIKQAAGKAGIVFRYGGEEFALVLPKLDLPAASRIGETIRSAIEGNNFDIGFNRKTKITISIGAAENRQKTFATGKDLLDAADKALYAAKAKGRNRVEVFTP